MLVSNIRENGKPIGSLPDREMQFHSDMCCIARPPKGTFLYAIEIPAEGGDMLFLSMYKACETLPADLRDEIENRDAMNVFLHGATSRDGDKPDFNVHPHHVHPLVLVPPDTGKKALYANRLMTWNIEGMDEDKSRAILDRLFAHIEQSQFIYAHEWRAGDLILRDNRCTPHARADFSHKELRLLRRVAVQA